MGIFIIGALAKSRKSVRLAESIFLTLLVGAWCILGVVLKSFASNSSGILYGVILLIVISGAVFSFLKWRSL